MQGTRGRAGKTAARAAFFAFSGLALMVSNASAAPPLIESTSIAKVATTSAVFVAKINPGGGVTRYRFEYGPEDCSSSPATPCTSVPVPEGKTAAVSSSVTVEVPVEGLTPATLYHYRVVAKNPTEVKGPDRVFATYGPTQGGLPDGRAYEQASPVNKDGGDAQGQQALVKATPDGNGVTFGSTFGIPGGKGAQELPTYLASRGTSNWSTEGLLPPFSVGERIRLEGWSPDYSRIYSRATKLGNPRTEGLVVQSGSAEPEVIAPYVPRGEENFAGEADGGAVVFFEAKAKLPPKEGGTPIPEAVLGIPNLYVWDRESGEVRLAGLFNQGAPKGSFAGPYDWSLGTNAFNLHEGGGQRSYYLQGMHAITPEGDVYFTAAGSGQLYLRINPTQPQSDLNGQGECIKPEEACTIQVSASQKTNGNGPGGTDPAGEQPAAFQAASEDGSEVFFTSTEKLTNNANTGPEQKPASISRAKLNGEVAEDVEAEFLPEHAVGVTRFGPWLYWADPSKGSIGRAKLNAQEEVEAGTVEPEFIVPPPSGGECEEEIEKGPEEGAFKPIEGPIPSEPRYVAVDAGHVYWTNTGLRDENGIPRDGGGTIGRATLDGSEEVEEIEPAFICGENKTQPKERLASNPQGIAVNATHVYWANAAKGAAPTAIARAAIDGSGATGEFLRALGSRAPYGIALSATHLYFVENSPSNPFGNLVRTNLEGGEEIEELVGEDGLRGIALDAGHVYWTNQGEGGAIGRADLELNNVEKDFIDVEGAPGGIAVGASNIFWSVNGEAAGNPGNDLYRFEPASNTLSDLTPLGTVGTGVGADVQGVLGVSADGTRIYFAANGVLAAGASQGDCEGSVRSAKGKCNLYLWQEGQISFIGRLDASGGESDAFDWVGTPREVQSGGGYIPRTAFLGDGGRVLVFRSQEQLSAYPNEGTPEYYRYDSTKPGVISCLSCRPSGEAAGGGPSLGSIEFPVLQPSGQVAGYASRNLSSNGKRFFFETGEALSPADTNGATGCLASDDTPTCLDVYEWEALGEGQCTESSPGYAPLDAGCIYLISTGKSPYPSFFADASEEGESVFFFTRQGLVGQDKDELQDVYDARVGGGLAAQNALPLNPCESPEACHGPAPAAPAEGTPATPSFNGPGNLSEKHKKQKPKKKKHKKHTNKKKQKQQKGKAKGGSK
jgi:hypothetical protein